MNFALAEKISAAASGLDDAISTSNVRDQATEKHINTLHACAISLAGSRAHELYSQEDDIDQLELAIAAGMACCGAEVTAGPGWAGIDTAVPA